MSLPHQVWLWKWLCVVDSLSALWIKAINPINRHKLNLSLNSYSWVDLVVSAKLDNSFKLYLFLFHKKKLHLNIGILWILPVFSSIFIRTIKKIHQLILNLIKPQCSIDWIYWDSYDPCVDLATVYMSLYFTKHGLYILLHVCFCASHISYYRKITLLL